jgi:hypothetical protein
VETVPKYRWIETHGGTLTQRRELTEADLRRERPELARLLDEGLKSLQLVTARREVHVQRIELDRERLQLALESAGFAFSDEVVQRLTDELRWVGQREPFADR